MKSLLIIILSVVLAFRVESTFGKIVLLFIAVMYAMALFFDPIKFDVVKVTSGPYHKCDNCTLPIQYSDSKCQVCGHDNSQNHICEYKESDKCIHCGKSAI